MNLVIKISNGIFREVPEAATVLSSLIMPVWHLVFRTTNALRSFGVRLSSQTANLRKVLVRLTATKSDIEVRCAVPTGWAVVLANMGICASMGCGKLHRLGLAKVEISIRYSQIRKEGRTVRPFSAAIVRGFS